MAFGDVRGQRVRALLTAQPLRRGPWAGFYSPTESDFTENG